MKNKSKKFSFMLLLALALMPTAAWAGWSIDSVRTVAEDAGLTTGRTVTEIIGSAISWLMALLSIVSVLMFVVAGIMYVTANGEEDTVTKAKKLITYAISGIVIALVGFLIVEAVGNIFGENL